MTEFSALAKKIMVGNLLFAGCCISYLFWWSVAFRPGYTPPTVLNGALFMSTALFGISGLALIIEGCAQTKGPVRFTRVIAAGATVFLLLVALTMILLHRMVTTELLLIVFWTCMEIIVCAALCGQGVFSVKGFRVLVAVILAAAIAGMVCYMQYYDLEAMTAFYDGMVPLILFAAVIIGIFIYAVLSTKHHQNKE